ncbi:MAG: hypothetical protein KC482_15440 [Dehalococcoidia bacterium]|nr:hypothetical protein [Dehalococcoidia bacterium]MCA9824787.1 hypothetical protein [Dehalococcoidia bacterium]MCA9844685.1 hypothetical protein [Dehalococcoidia bacterium]MCA9854952.1 hypothetical protein [Dehalococcoidia bacterium]
MTCPFCGSSEIYGPSRVTADWRPPTRSGSRQWYVPEGPDVLVACGTCHEEFDAVQWYGSQAPALIGFTAA